MDGIINFNIDEVIPESENILAHQGIPAGSRVNGNIENLLFEAVKKFTDLARPLGKSLSINIDEFSLLMEGEDENADDILLRSIYPDAENLAMFVLTMGSGVSEYIEKLFEKNDYAIAAMLDSVASTAADKAVSVLEERFKTHWNQNSSIEDTTNKRVLAYSPGYCGWHVSGQKKLFKYLNPGEIGITLNNSSLMTPLKSVSGVLIYGDKEIHIFKNNFSYCRTCKTKNCRERIISILH